MKGLLEYQIEKYINESIINSMINRNIEELAINIMQEVVLIELGIQNNNMINS